MGAHAVIADAAVEARSSVTFIDVDAAIVAAKPLWASAIALIDEIDAHSTILARRSCTLIDINLAELAAEARWTEAPEGVNFMCRSGILRCDGALPILSHASFNE